MIPHVIDDSSNVPKIQRQEAIALASLKFSGWLIVGILIFILMYIFYYGLPGAFSFKYLFSSPEGGRFDDGGILYQIISTVYLVFGATLISAPIGIGAAIYLNEYAAKNSVTNLIRFAIENLAGIPSIIYGLFGLAFFVIFLKFEYSLLAGALSCSIMVLPIIIRTTEEALKGIPDGLRQSSLALGVNKWYTIYKVVLPPALPGILTGILLSIGRIIGESAILILAAGGSITAMPMLLSGEYPYFLPDSARTLAVHLYYQATSYDARIRAFSTSVVLIFMILAINFLVDLIATKYRKRFQVK